MPPKRLRPLVSSDEKPGKRPRHSLNTPCVGKPCPCDQCHLSYEKRPSLRRHKGLKHGKMASFNCEHCGDPFQRPEGVRNHVLKNRCSAANTLDHRLGLRHNAVPAPKTRGVLFAPSSDSPPSNLAIAASTTDSSCSAKTPYPPNSLEVEVHASTRTPYDRAVEDRLLREGQNTAWSPHIDDVLCNLSCLENALTGVHGFDSTHVRHSDFSHSASQSLTLGKHLGSRHKGNCAGDILYHPKQNYSPIALHEWGHLAPRERTSLSSWRAERSSQPSPLCCTTRRVSSTAPFPPSFNFPPPQDLEHLLWEQDRAKRRARVMESFQLTHRKFMDGESRPEVTQGLLSDAWDGRLAHHQIHFRQAWKDGVQAARRLLSGHLPRELYSVLGVA
jgi:hypothetical protein